MMDVAYGRASPPFCGWGVHCSWLDFLPWKRYHQPMILFTVLLFPLAFAIWLKGRDEAAAPSFFNAFLGVFLSAVYCAYKYFLSPFYFLTPDSFFRNFIHIFLEQTFLPLGVLTFAFLIVYKKDKLSQRLQKIFPFYMGFYAVYLPFRILNEALPYSAFGLFAKPILYLLSIAIVFQRQKALFIPAERALLDGKSLAAAVFSYAAALIMPAAVEALWILGMGAPLVIVFVLLSAASAVLCFVQEKGKN